MRQTRWTTLAAIVAALSMIGATDEAAAQSQFVDAGANGVFVGGGVGTGSDVDNVAASAGVVLAGRLDLGVGLNRASFGDTDMSALELMPFASVMVLKQSRTMPISVALGGMYHTASYSADELDELGWDMSASGFSFGGNVYASLPASPTMRIVPDVGVTYFTGDVKIEDAIGDEVTADASGTTYSFGSAVAFTLPNASIFNIRAGGAVNEEGDTRFGLNVGMTFSLSPGIPG
jgi:hypothetical protein